MHYIAFFAKLHGRFGVLDVNDGMGLTHRAGKNHFVAGFKFRELEFRREFRPAFSLRLREGCRCEGKDGERDCDDGLKRFHAVGFFEVDFLSLYITQRRRSCNGV